MVIKDHRDILEKKAAEILGQAIREIIADRNQAVVAVPGGRSVGAVLGQMENELIDWARVHFFMVDERLVPPDHAQSNFNLVASVLGSFVPRQNLHPFPLDRAGHRAALQAYDSELGQYGGQFDAVLLSSGEDGHVASLFPGHETIFSDEKMFLLTSSAPKPPPDRMSASRQLIGSSRAGVLLFFGKEKADALGMFQDDSLPLHRCPAKIVNNLQFHYVLTDVHT